MTLLDRRELAEHIRRVETVELPNVDEDNEWDEAAIADQSAFETRLASFAEGMQKLLHEFATLSTRPHSENLESYWVQSIFQPEACSVDGALALLLALAVNAEVVDIQRHQDTGLAFTSNVIALRRGDLHIHRPSASLSRLSELCITGWSNNIDIDIMVPPSVRILRLIRCQVENLKYDWSSPSQIEVLELRGIQIKPLALSNFLTDSRCQHLRELLLNHVQYFATTDFTWDNEFDSGLIETLEIIAPELEVLRFIDVVTTFQWLAPIGSLKNFRKLHTLALGIDRLIFADGTEETQPIDPFAMLPPRLRRLELLMMPNFRLNKYFEDPHANALIPSGSQFIVDALKNFPLRNLLLETEPWGTGQRLDISLDTSEGTLTGLQALADQMFSKGTVLEASVFCDDDYEQCKYHIIPATCSLGDEPSTGV
jgi:hypothetical protein